MMVTSRGYEQACDRTEMASMTQDPTLRFTNPPQLVLHTQILDDDDEQHRSTRRPDRMRATIASENRVSSRV